MRPLLSPFLRPFLRPFFRLVVWLMILAPTLMEPVYAQDSTAYAVTYVEVMPSAIANGATLLKRYRDASRKQDGNVRSDVLQEIARPNRFAVVEAWNKQAALDAHGKAPGTGEPGQSFHGPRSVEQQSGARRACHGCAHPQFS